MQLSCRLTNSANFQYISIRFREK